MFKIVTKFGGTSVSSRQTWDNILKITKQHLASNKRPVIVCSALTNASNQLEALIQAACIDQHAPLLALFTARHHTLAKELGVDSNIIQDYLHQLHQWLTGIALLKEAPPKTYAQILSLGELMMTRLGHAFLIKQGINVLWFDARGALISMPTENLATASDYYAARCEGTYNPELVAQFASFNADVVITQGFIASNSAGDTVLLGRGGSDTSSALFAAMLNADICEIWTDVPGIYTANPHQIPHARLLKQLNYDEAQEIASMGAKVLHPLCIPPVRNANIPMVVKYTCMPEHSGTLICKNSDPKAPPIKSIQVTHGITVISIDTVTMWRQVGFLADVFTTFKQHGFAVDLLSSSEANITLSLDRHHISNNLALEALLKQLNTFSRARLIDSCSSISLVGHHIRKILPKLGTVLEVFDEQQIHLMSLASNDLNLTFVVDECKAEQLCQQLHNLLIETNPQSFYYSKSWHEEFGQPASLATAWWETSRTQLLNIAANHSPCYIYNCATIISKAQALQQLSNIDSLFYAVKANPHPAILTTLFATNINFECVSIEELQHIFNLFPDINPKRVIFTPNFAAQTEYAYAMSTNCNLTIDSLYPLTYWPELFRNRDVFLRIDPGSGSGHHRFVCTGGNESKFGIPLCDLDIVIKLTQQHNINVIGLHSHSGSGILSVELWKETAQKLSDLSKKFPNVATINLGGGLGVAEQPGQISLNLNNLNASLASIKQGDPSLKLWLEPGRFFVAESGILLAKVTQCKNKGKIRFIGIETGMNSLIRPALYGSYHHIVNLTRFNEPHDSFAHVVGPICESGDTLGYDRMLPHTLEGDILLIANTGAYGHCMSSCYNLRLPAGEIILNFN